MRRCLDGLGIENRWDNASGKENASLLIQIVKGYVNRRKLIGTPQMKKREMAVQLANTTGHIEIETI